VFEYAGRKFLFSGDLQTEDSGSQFSPVPVTAELQTEINQLRQAMIQMAPFDFVKLGHHGSHNACSEDLLNSYKGTVEYGICLGEFSKTHPDPEVVLPLLAARSKEIQWLRTDYNRLCGFTWSAAGDVEFFKEAGRLNDTRKNKFDLGGRLAGGGAGQDQLPPLVVGFSAPSSGPALPMALFESTIPFGDGSVSLQFTVLPGVIAPSIPASPSVQGTELSNSRRPQPSVRPPGDGTPVAPAIGPQVRPPDLAKGRKLPKLLFVTSADALRGNIGREETRVLLKTIADQGHVSLVDLPNGLKLTDASSVIQQVRQKVVAEQGIEGIVLLGGYDVIPSRQLNTLPEGEEETVAQIDDPDRWIVWCDDEYAASASGEALRYYSLPISRVPDQHYAPYLFQSLEAPLSPGGTFSGVRNLKRPFAARISPAFKDAAPLHVSAPVTYLDGYSLMASSVYLMLHGSAVNSLEFEGENAARQRTRAFRLEKIPDAPGCVVLAGCCWGALTATTPAAFASDSAPTGVKGRDASIALRFLAKGARAFVGCTGAHYSPRDDQPDRSAGGAMHSYFWQYFLNPAVRGPAEALQFAKREFVGKMPHAPEVASSLAIDSKTLHQFTCLGLGW